MKQVVSARHKLTSILVPTRNDIVLFMCACESTLSLPETICLQLRRFGLLSGMTLTKKVRALKRNVY